MFIGIDIGGTKCAVISGEKNKDGNMEITEKIRYETAGFPPEKTLPLLVQAVYSLSDKKQIEAIGISCGGPLDSKNGIIMSPPNLPGWDDVHITEYFSGKFGVPAYLENDANACALAEWRYGAGKGSDNMIFLTFGTGLGAGLILDGRLYTGTNGMAGEAGHIRLSEHGPSGYGKCGSFEGFCSGGGIAALAREKAREALQRAEKTAYCKDVTALDGITAKAVADAANSGDKTALEVFRISGEMLGRGLSVLIDILNPEVIVIGSVFARSRNLLWEHTKKIIEAEALGASVKVCRVEAAALGEAIGDFAALAVADCQ